jgi:NADH:ubiquinone oxidoreductase subunit C
MDKFLISNFRYVSPAIYVFLRSRYLIVFQQMLFFNNIFNRGLISLCINQTSLVVKPQPHFFLSYLFFLQKHTLTQYRHLLDITAIDFLKTQYRFQLFYQLVSLPYSSRLMCTIDVDEKMLISTVSFLYNSASWFECEIWDFFGIFFFDHPQLHRLLTDYGFRYYPLRKDFPVTGYTELFYNESKQRVGYYKISLAQEFRNYVFASPWR